MRHLSPVLFLALLLSACSREPGKARVDAALAPLIPADTQVLAGFRLDKLKNTPFYKTYVEGKQIPMLEEFARKTGLDPRKDMWEIVAASNGKRYLLLVRGKFGEMFGFEPKIQIEGMRRLNYKSFPVYATGDYALMFVQSGVAMAGPLELLQAVIDNRDNAKEKPPQALLDLVGTLPGSAHFWIATTNGGALVPDMPRQGNMANFTRMATALQRFTLSADLAKGLDLKADGQYPDDRIATQTYNALKGFVGLARLQTKSDQTDLLRLYDGILVRQQGTEITVTAQAPFELIDKLRGMLPLAR
jgi:hypothetical protein